MSQMYDFSVLRALRQREGLTLAELSERSGVSSAVISKIERNQTQAELGTLYRLSRAFGMNSADLLNLAERNLAQTQAEATHQAGEFSFRQIGYGNVRVLYGEAPTGARLSDPEIHKDDYELCWVLKGGLRVRLPDEHYDLVHGNAIQFDAVLGHTYEALEDCALIILHMTKEKRF